tara:strand:+ start:5358 stop:5798 length:441 start_codon:yes stop_codon:yes gene_type:complete
LSAELEYIDLLKKILTLLKNSKLEYLKASDESNISKDKRYLNLQSTFRNRYFQDVTKLLRSLNVQVEDLVIHRLNFEEMVISSIKKTNYTHLHKCVGYDRKLLGLYDEAIALQPNASVLKIQQIKISKSVSESIYFLESAGFILES